MKDAIGFVQPPPRTAASCYIAKKSVSGLWQREEHGYHAEAMKRNSSPTTAFRPHLTVASTLFVSLTLWAVSAHAMPRFGTSGLTNVDVGNEAKPVLADLDGDGDLDAFIGDWQGQIRYFRNDGSPQAPHFIAADYRDNPLAGLHVDARATPVFVDSDNDGDLDLYVGDWEGRIKYFQNYGSASAPEFAEFDAYDPFNNVDVGRFAAPAFIDVDGDGDLDAIVGSWDRSLLYFQNTGLSHRPDFNLMPDRDNPFKDFALGQSLIPAVADIDQDGDDDIVVGAWNGRVSYIRNGGSARQPLFWPAAGSANPLHRLRAQRGVAPAFGDIDNDGDLDAFVGHADGSVHYFHNNGRPQQPDIYPTERQPETLAELWREQDIKLRDKRLAISMNDLDNDGLLDLFINIDGQIQSYRGRRASLVDAGSPAEASSESAPAFSPLTDKHAWVPGHSQALHTAPVFVDIDADGDLDAFVGGSDGRVYYLLNSGTPQAPVLTWSSRNPLGSVQVDRLASPAFADLDGDGDLDAVIGSRAGPLAYYRNEGNVREPRFVASNEAEGPLMRLEVDAKSSPLLADFDLDGDADLIVGGEDGSLRYFLNLSRERNSLAIARFAPQTQPFNPGDGSGNPLYGLGGGSEAIASSADIDGDGDQDLLLGAIGEIRLITNHDPRPWVVDDSTLCAVDRYKTTQNVLDNDRFKPEAPREDFYIEHIEPRTTKGGRVVRGDNDTFDYTPAAGFRGQDSFRYTLSNGQGVSAEAWVIVDVVVDRDPPKIPLPTPFAVEPADAQGIPLNHPRLQALLGSLEARDAVDGRIHPVEVRLPPTLLRGDNAVELRARDVSGNEAVLPAVLKVADATPPQVTPPADLTLAAPHAGPMAISELALDEFIQAARAEDDFDGVISAIQHDLPAALPLGETLVTFSATDAAGNTGHASARIFLLDQDAPTLEAPPDLTLTATNRWGMPATDRRVIKFLEGVQAEDNVGIESIRHNAPGHFPLGRTTVRFTARDAAGNVSHARANVTINPQ